MITKIFSAAIAVFVGFRVLFFIKTRTPISIKLKHHLSYVLPFFELLSWIGLLIWVARLIYVSKNYFALISSGIIFIIFIVPLFILLRDFLVGIFLKSQNKVTEGSFVEIEDKIGQIRKAGHFMLDIEDNHGNIDSIPYNYIRSKVISRYGANQNLEKIVLEFTFPSTKNVNDIVTNLKNQIINTPWVAISQAPIIENVKTENEKTIIEIGVYALNKIYGENIKNMVNAYFENHD